MAQSPDCQAGGPEADRGAGRGRAGKQFLPLLSPVELGGRGREREDSFQGGSLAQCLLGGRGRGL